MWLALRLPRAAAAEAAAALPAASGALLVASTLRQSRPALAPRALGSWAAAAAPGGTAAAAGGRADGGPPGSGPAPAPLDDRQRPLVIIALGSNLGDRVAHLRAALSLLRQRAGFVPAAQSWLYESAPAYVCDQPRFLNAAVAGTTHLPPEQLLDAIKSIERDRGRPAPGSPGAPVRFGPRPLDLDIISYGSESLHTERLELPHPRFRERGFVLAPLADLAEALLPPAAPLASAAAGGPPSGRASAAPSGAAGGQGGVTGDAAAGADADAAEPLRARVLRGVEAVWRAELNAAGEPAGPGPGSMTLGGGASAAPPCGTRALLAEAWQLWRARGGSEEGLFRVMPLGAAGPPAASAGRAPAAASAAADADDGSPGGAACGLSPGGLWRWGRRTHVMGILNLTPDSFSDGGDLLSGGGCGGGGGGSDRGGPLFGAAALSAHDLSAVVAAARRMVEEGADILDLGGQSTRPGSALLSAAEEAARVLPAIEALAADPILRGAHVALSVDTFHAEVAMAAAAAGAAFINDVSGGSMDARMHAAVAGLDSPCAYVLMHMRGTPQTMQSPQNLGYGPDVVADVAAELTASARAAAAAGLEPWRIILDPGLSFAKTAAHNWAILRGLPRLRAALGASGPAPAAVSHAPLLLGPSRKGFLGAAIAGQARGQAGSGGGGAPSSYPPPPPPPPRERDWATAAAVAASVAGGADIVRVHNVRAGVHAARVADAIWRA